MATVSSIRTKEEFDAALKATQKSDTERMKQLYQAALAAGLTVTTKVSNWGDCRIAVANGKGIFGNYITETPNYEDPVHSVYEYEDYIVVDEQGNTASASDILGAAFDDCVGETGTSAIEGVVERLEGLEPGADIAAEVQNFGDPKAKYGDYTAPDISDGKVMRKIFDRAVAKGIDVLYDGSEVTDCRVETKGNLSLFGRFYEDPHTSETDSSGYKLTVNGAEYDSTELAGNRSNYGPKRDDAGADEYEVKQADERYKDGCTDAYHFLANIRLSDATEAEIKEYAAKVQKKLGAIAGEGDAETQPETPAPPKSVGNTSGTVDVNGKRIDVTKLKEHLAMIDTAAKTKTLEMEDSNGDAGCSYSIQQRQKNKIVISALMNGTPTRGLSAEYITSNADIVKSVIADATKNGIRLKSIPGIIWDITPAAVPQPTPAQRQPAPAPAPASTPQPQQLVAVGCLRHRKDRKLAGLLLSDGKQSRMFNLAQSKELAKQGKIKNVILVAPTGMKPYLKGNGVSLDALETRYID
jgi:hypothetical protein